MTAWADKPLDESEFPDEEDLLDDDDEVLGRITPCPHCGCGVYEDAPQCPRCRQWITPGGGSWRLSRKWYVRRGLWLARTLLINWLFWIALSAVTAAAIWMRRN